MVRMMVIRSELSRWTASPLEPWRTRPETFPWAMRRAWAWIEGRSRVESGLKKVTRGVYIPGGGTGEFAIMHEEGFVL